VTLVLGGCTSKAVVLGADSTVWVATVDTDKQIVVASTSRTDRKLFKLARAGIATYGGAAEHVPTVLTNELKLEWSVSEVIGFLQQRFKSADQMRALVGGLENGAPVLFEVGMSDHSLQPIVSKPGRPPPVALRGLRHGAVDQRPPGTVASVIEQMLELLAETTGPHVGPPYEFLVISDTPGAGRQ
jgi:hypothetical protein